MGIVTPPQTPPRAPRTPQSKVTPAWSPPRTKKASTPLRDPTHSRGGYSLLNPCTPPRKTPPRRMVHNPYRLPGTPPACKSPALKKSPLNGLRASPKPRTPTRTRTILQRQNTPKTPALGSHLSVSVTPQSRAPAAESMVSEVSTPVPVRPAALNREAASPTPELSTATTQFLQFTVTEHLPPSLQQPAVPQYNVSTPALAPFDNVFQTPEDNRQVQIADQGQIADQYGYRQQYTPASNELLQAPTTTYAVSQPAEQVNMHYSPTPLGTPQYNHMQGNSANRLASNYDYAGASTPSVLDFSIATPSQQSSYHMPSVVPGTPQSPVGQSPGGSSISMASPAQSLGYSGSPSTPQQSNMPTKIYMLVEFKRGRTVQFQSTFFSQPGEYVVVEGDNGEDMGMVVNAWVAPASSPPVVNNSLNSNKNSNGNDVDPVTGDPIYPKVIRHATAKEVQYLHNAQAQAELKCTEVAKHKVLEHQLQMTVVDAEYQFDRKKLTFYYDAGERIDFRELVRDLYKLYRARIWMSKVRQHDNMEERRSK